MDDDGSGDDGGDRSAERTDRDDARSGDADPGEKGDPTTGEPEGADESGASEAGTATDAGESAAAEVTAAVRDVMGPEALTDDNDVPDGASTADGSAGEPSPTDGPAEASSAASDRSDGSGTADDDGRPTGDRRATGRSRAGGDTPAGSASGDGAGGAPEPRDSRDDVESGATGSGGASESTAGAATGTGRESGAGGPTGDESEGVTETAEVPEDVRTYDRFTKIDGGTYERANEFLRDRTYITAREWAMARLCADFRTETGVEMTKIGENLPRLVPFMTDTYSPQAVNQARAAFEEKVRKAGATFLYGAMCDFFTAEELDDVMYEATEVAKFLLEVEGVELSVEEELAAEDHVSEVMREVREHSTALRHDECPECGHELDAVE